VKVCSGGKSTHYATGNGLFSYRDGLNTFWSAAPFFILELAHGYINNQAPIHRY